jgi:hypothetical protein
MYLGSLKVFLLRIGAVLAVILGGLIFNNFPADSFDGQCRFDGSGIRLESQDLRISEIMLCEGLNKGGKPYRSMDVGKAEEWEEIHICAQVRTSSPTTLTAHWYYGNGIEFAGRGVIEEADRGGYIAFSLEEAVMCSDRSVFQNYLADELAAGYLPAGQYRVEIYQGNLLMQSFAFLVED